MVSDAATAGDDEFVIDAPSATSIKVSGSTGAGADKITIKIDDTTPSVSDVRQVTVDTSNLSISGSDSIVFDFEAAEDLVILKEASDISQFDTIEIAKGTADLRSVTIKDGVDLIVNSGVILTQAQFAANSLTVGLASDERHVISSDFIMKGYYSKRLTIGWG